MIMDNKYLRQAPEEEGHINLNDIWKIGLEIVWDHKWWYVGSVVISLMLCTIHLYRTPDTYIRTAKIIIDESDQDAALRSIGSLAAGAVRMQAGTSVANEMQALSSPDLMQSVVERLHLETRYIKDEILRDIELYTDTPVEMRLAGNNPQSSFSFKAVPAGEGKLILKEFIIGPDSERINSSIECAYKDTVDTPAGKLVFYPAAGAYRSGKAVRISWRNSMSVAKDFVHRLSVSRSGKESTVVQISFKDNFPSRASDIISTLIDIYNEDWVRTRNESARNTSAFINERLVIIEKELGGIENDLKRYKEVNKLTNMDAISKAYIDETSEYAAKGFEVSNQLSIAQYIKDYLNNPTNESALIPANLGLTTDNIETQITEYNSLILQRDRLSTGSGRKNPLITDLNNSIASLRSAILRSVDNSIATLQLQAQKIQAQENQIMSRIALNSGQELQLLSIQRQQMVKESLYIFLLQKREENELASLVNVGNSRTIERPEGPSAPISPDKLLALILSLFIGMGIPFAVLMIIRISDNTIRSRSDLSESSIPFLGEIPLSAKRNRLGFVRKSEQFNNKNCRIMVEAGKRDMMNEAFRVLRTNLDIIINRHPGKAFIAMLTSFHPNAGKTFIIQNLAACMSLKNTHVLIIDLDLRKATVSKASGCGHTGIAAYLNSRTTDLNSLICRITTTLHILPVGNIPPNPTELLLGERFGEMMEELRKSYDYIFIDCPPIDIVADASIISKHADMTIFVIRAGMLDRRMLPALEDIYRSGRFSRTTLILNGVDIESRDYGTYGYNYGYGNTR